MTVLGMDISNWQGRPNFGAVAGAGYGFVIAKATEATSYVDPVHDSSRAGAKAAGMVFGSYHFARLGNATAEADYFLQHANPQPGELTALDLEVTAPGVDVVAWSATWCARVKTVTNGCPPLIYLNGSLLHGNNWQRVLNLNCSLWLAAPDGNQSQPAPGIWPYVSFKQFSWKGSVPGIAGDVDLDVFYGDRARLAQYTIAGGPPPPPPPPPSGGALPAVLSWNLPAGQYYGNVDGPDASVGANYNPATGQYDAPNAFVRNIQQWLIYHGCTSVPAAQWAVSDWVDGVWGPDTDAAMTDWHNRFYPQPYPDQCWDDDYARLAR